MPTSPVLRRPGVPVSPRTSEGHPPRWTGRPGGHLVRAVLVALVVALGMVGLAVPAQAATCPCSLWSDSDVPAVVDAGDPAAVELGLHFTVDVASPAVGLRFYTADANTGVHVGSLWTADGQLLARATFAGESANGWQQVTFDAPVQLAAATVYVVSYHTNVGHYSVDPQAFSTTGRDNGILHAPGGTAGVPNGIFAYSPDPTFPTGTFNGNNYWVDPVIGTNAPVLTGIVVTPPSASIMVGAQATLTATGSYSDGSTADVTGQVTWTSGAPTVATVSAAGVVTGTGAGTASVTATLGSSSATSVLTVRRVTAVAIGGAPATLAKGLTKQLSATATLSDGTTVDVTSTATWASAKPSVATVSATGLVTTTGVGSAAVSASYGGASTSATVTVTTATLVGLTVTPVAPTIGRLGSVFLTATARYSDGTLTNVTGQAQWSSSSFLLASVANFLTPCRVQAFLFTGTVQITAGYGGLQTRVPVTIR